ncbi:site-specific DNA-methyltransferase [Desulfonema magnum]|nr:site-specific DNA-methyltransferase [Desulfonema magnum]
MHIPSKEEAGYEKANAKVREKKTAAFPLNPVTHRGQDPELFWLNKYANDDRETLLKVDIRSLYRHEHISPEILIENLYKLREEENQEQLSLFELFGNGIQMDELDKVAEYYRHQDDWTNRMILGDSLLVMTSLLEREGMAGKVQMIYIDPPYGIRYGSNWQMKLDNRNVADGKDDHLSGEPEQIKAYRDTWELGIHSYLSYLRDRLLVAKDLLTESGSCFVQISDENVHLVRCLMDEVFGSENFVRQIIFFKTTSKGGKYLDENADYIIWYGKNSEFLKYRQLYLPKKIGGPGAKEYKYLMLKNGEWKALRQYDLFNPKITSQDKLFSHDNFTSQSGGSTTQYSFEFDDKKINPPSRGGWKTNLRGLENLIKKDRIILVGNTPRFVRYFNDFPIYPISTHWDDTRISGFSNEKHYVVQTYTKVIQRCLLMTTDPGDLVLDPTCGSGTTAYMAEQWGRRWITIDTSRIALNIAKTRVMTATFPFYKLHDEKTHDICQGFIYKKVPHITLKSLANDESPAEETLYDQPYEDKKRLRVAGPFTVETLQSLDIASPESLEQTHDPQDKFEARIFEHLMSAGVKNGIKNEHAVFTRVDALNSPYLHAEGFYQGADGEKKAYLHIGPKFGTVNKLMVNEAVKECRTRGDADWLIILGFSFDSDISNRNETTSLGSFEVTKVRMHDDLMQEGLLKKDKKAASFVTIGEPDVRLNRNGKTVQVELLGLDIYDPIRDQIKARNIHDIAYWMTDDDYDGSNFIVRQVFFCGGNKKEMDNWKKGLDKTASARARKTAEKIFKIEIDQHAFDRLYGHLSHPIEIKKNRQKIAVRVISQFGEESMKVLEIEN